MWSCSWPRVERARSERLSAPRPPTTPSYTLSLSSASPSTTLTAGRRFNAPNSVLYSVYTRLTALPLSDFWHPASEASRAHGDPPICFQRPRHGLLVSMFPCFSVSLASWFVPASSHLVRSYCAIQPCLLVVRISSCTCFCFWSWLLHGDKSTMGLPWNSPWPTAHSTVTA